MKKKAVVIMAVMAGIFAMTACEQKTTTVKSEKTEKTDAEKVSSKTDQEDTAISDNIYAFQVSVDGKILRFPMEYSKFTKTGWEYTGDEETSIPADDGILSDWFKKGDDMALAYIQNFDSQSVMVSESYITGMLLTNNYMKNEEREILLPGGLQLGTSTQDEAIQLYGEPTDSMESDTFPTITYELDVNQFVTLTFDTANGGSLSEITMKNEIQPDDFEVSEKADDAVSEEGAYQAPEEISSELFDYTVSFDGALYQIPAPVSEYIANGWKLVERESDILIESQKSGKVTLTKDGQTFETYVKNDSESTEEVVRCLVTNLTANVKDCDVEMEISDGIHMGMSQANLEAAIAAYEYKKDTSSYIYYEITNPEQEGSGYEIIVKDGIVTGIEIALKMK